MTELQKQEIVFKLSREWRDKMFWSASLQPPYAFIATELAKKAKGWLDYEANDPGGIGISEAQEWLDVLIWAMGLAKDPNVKVDRSARIQRLMKEKK